MNIDNIHVPVTITVSFELEELDIVISSLQMYRNLLNGPREMYSSEEIEAQEILKSVHVGLVEARQIISDRLKRQA